MTADVSADDRRPPTSIRDSGGSMPFSEADFTRDAARLVAEGDRVPAQREPDERLLVRPLGGEPYAVDITYDADEGGAMRVSIKPERAGQEISPDDLRLLMGRLNPPSADRMVG